MQDWDQAELAAAAFPHVPDAYGQFIDQQPPLSPYYVLTPSPVLPLSMEAVLPLAARADEIAEANRPFADQVHDQLGQEQAYRPEPPESFK